MPSTDYLPEQDAQLSLWLQNFYTVADDRAPELSLSPAELTVIQNAKNAFQNDLGAVESAKQAYREAVGTKNDDRATVVGIVRRYAREFKANPNVSPGTLLALGIVSNRTSGPVVPVTGLTVTGCSDGMNKLKWNRNGNAASTTFLVEYQVVGTNVWLFAAATTTLKFDHTGQTPGQAIRYRVTSTRAGMTSVPCPPVTVYDGLGGNGAVDLKLAA